MTPTLERNELSFNFLCLKRQSPWVCLRIAVGWSELAKMGVGGGCGWCTAAVGGHSWGGTLAGLWGVDEPGSSAG